MAFKTQKEAEKEVRGWGFKHVFTWTDTPDYVYPPHNHKGLTTHLIIRGEMTITFPKDETPTKTTYGVGERIDVEARREHQVWIGKEGCTMVIGE